MRLRLILLLVGGSLIGSAAVSGAGVTTTTIDIHLTLDQQQTVTVTARALDFGRPAGPLTSTSTTITVNAPNGLPYKIGLNGGLHFSGHRALYGPNGALNPVLYALYRDNLFQTPWGDGTPLLGGQSGLKSGTGSGHDVPHTVYGVTTDLSNKPDGMYTDIVTVIVTF